MEDTMFLPTLALVFFGGVQLLAMVSTEVRARRERARDEAAEKRRLQQEEDVAYQTCYAEHVRLWALGSRYRESDLIDLSVAGLLRPEDLLPRDWGLMTQMLGRLSAEAGYLGAMAIASTHDVAASLAAFNAMIAQFTSASVAVDLVGSLKRQRDTKASALGEKLAAREESIRSHVEDAALLLWDAISHSTPARRERTLKFNDDLASAMGKALENALAERAKTLPHAPGGLDSAS